MGGYKDPSAISNLAKRFGKRIVEIREAQGLTQAQLARRMGYEGTSGPVCDYEKAYREATLAKVEEFAVALGVDAIQLLSPFDVDLESNSEGKATVAAKKKSPRSRKVSA